MKYEETKLINSKEVSISDSSYKKKSNKIDKKEES